LENKLRLATLSIRSLSSDLNKLRVVVILVSVDLNEYDGRTIFLPYCCARNTIVSRRDVVNEIQLVARSSLTMLIIPVLSRSIELNISCSIPRGRFLNNVETLESFNSYPDGDEG
jgi:hypothetical protein